jgi:pimeloyl-ACP methyl ester carboxylesterase
VGDEMVRCREQLKRTHGTRLEHLTVSDAARDLNEAIRSLRGDARVLLWGNSYGTYWAQRFIELYPDAVDGVFLEALVPIGSSYRTFDYWMNDAGMRLMERCAADATCRTRFGADPVGVARALPARLAAGHCSTLGLPVRVSGFLGSLLYDHDLRGLVPVLVRRLDRCSAEDVVRVRRAYQALFRDKGMLTAGDFCPALYAHVVFSELWSGAPPGGANLDEVEKTCLFCPADRGTMDAARASWPRYTTHVKGARTYEGPLWMLQGGFDPAIPPATAAAMKDGARGAHQHYFAFPFGAHTLTGKTPTPSGDCALRLLQAFVEDPTQTPPDRCIDEVPPPNLWPENLARAFFGPGDAWNGESTGP